MALTTRAIGAAAILLAGAAAWAAEDPPAPPPQSLREMAICRAIAAVEQRALCYDRAFDAFEVARRNRDVVVVDRTEVTKARRSLFGLNLPRLDIFSRGETKAEAKAFETLETTIRAVSPAGSGRWSLELEDGARWVQADDEPLASPPRAGDAIRIRRGAMGSYLANIKGQRAIRIRRVN